MKQGWWQREIAAELQQFAVDLFAGKRPVLIIQAPPQHGKSVQVIEFLAWVFGQHPELQTIFASFSERLGVRANLRLRRIFNMPVYKAMFPDLHLPTPADKDYSLNRSLLEFVGEEGYFRNTTVEGSVTGESLGLGVIDDPIKGRAEANSETVRDKTWDWLTDDFYTRFAETGGLLMILTRWHIDDPAGRLQAMGLDNMKVLKYPAIAIEDEKHRKTGEALFPEHKSLGFLLDRKKVQGISNFEAVYQQSPIIMGGSVFKEVDFRYFTTPRKYKQIVQSWDTAYKPNQYNDPSVCTTWGVHDSGYDLLDVYRGRIAYPKLKKEAVRLAEYWGSKKELYAGHLLFSILIEDKASGISLIQELRLDTTYNITAIEPEGDKVTRAHVVSPQFEAGKVFLLAGAPWLEDYKTELLQFPDGATADQVDSTTQFLSCVSLPKSGTITDDYSEGDASTETDDNPW